MSSHRKSFTSQPLVIPCNIVGVLGKSPIVGTWGIVSERITRGWEWRGEGRSGSVGD